jgi:hypothetical protein
MSYRFSRSIVFKEENNERVFNASTDDLLAESCLIVLRERYNNPAWNYKPLQNNLEVDEVEFLSFYELEGRYLPQILKRYADRIFDQLNVHASHEDDPDWTWYEGVKTLLALPPDEASGYKIHFRGRVVPTSYYLLLRRQNLPNESISLVMANR